MPKEMAELVEWRTASTALPLIGMAADRGTADGRPAGSDDLYSYLLANREEVRRLLDSHGAILFRGFNVVSPERFQVIAGVLCGTLGDYAGGNSPRTRVFSHVFTSTEYPKEERISMHNEASYVARMPSIVLFCCVQPSATGGQTPIADCRRVLERIDPAVRKRFEDKGIRYVNNLNGGRGLGRSWKQAFGIDDRAELERRLKADGQEFEWKADGRLRTSMVAPAIVRHPRTQEEVWINQAEQWHSSSLDSTLREELLSILAEEDFPHNAFLGDGSPLNIADLENVRAAMAAEETQFDWRQGDVLVCDNYLVMHGRQPYTGNRRVVVSMGW